MANSLIDRVWFNTATTGAGTVTIGSPVTGYQTPAAAGAANGATFSYVITDGNAWELGRGTYNAGAGTVTRSLLSSSTGALLSLSGSATMAFTALAEDLVAMFTPPQVTVLSSGSGTYNTPAGALYLVLEMVGGGGGGAGVL